MALFPGWSTSSRKAGWLVVISCGSRPCWASRPRRPMRLAGLPEPVPPAEAATTGGTVASPCASSRSTIPPPRTMSITPTSVRQVCDLLTRTGADNVTRPWLLEKWTASDDLKTWTLYLKKGSNGRTAMSSTATTSSGTSRAGSTRRPAPRSSACSALPGGRLRHGQEGRRRQGGDGHQALFRQRDREGRRLYHQAERPEAKLAVPENLFHYHRRDPASQRTRASSAWGRSGPAPSA